MLSLNYFNKIEKQNEVVMNEYPKLLTVQSFMVGGLVSYEDTGDGIFLLRKETLDKMMPTIEGRPVVIGHQPITLKNLEEKAVGYVTKGWFNPETGQFDCEILIKDSDVYNDIKNGNNKVSSAYQVTELGKGGKYLGQDYEAEILDGTFTHLAIVDNPRYPDAKILINSLNGEKEMGLFNMKNNNEDKLEVKASDTIEFNGRSYQIGELVNSYLLLNEDEEEKNEEEKKEEVEEKIEEKKNQGNCKRNEDDEDKKENEDDEDEKKNEDSDDELVTKVRKIVAEMLEKKDEEEEKKNKRNEDKDDKDNEDEEDKKENKNALRLRNSYYAPRAETNSVITRAERIKSSNAKYSI